MRIRSRRFVSLAGLTLALAGCSRCGKTALISTGPSDPAELAPGTAQVVVLVPSTLRLGQHAQQLAQLKIVSLAAQLMGLGDGRAFIDDLKRQLGFDPTTVDGARAVGLEPTSPILSAHTTQGDLVVVAVADAATF